MAEPSEAAVAVTTDMVSELVQKTPGTEDLREELEQVEPVEAPQGEQPQEETVAQEVEHEMAPSYEVELPEDLLAELDTPDFEEEAEHEIEAAPETYDEYAEEDSEERKKRIAAERKAQWFEGRLNEQNRSKWEDEAKKYFPLSEHALKDIKANSRRAFLREARAAHDKVLPYVKPLVERLISSTEQAKADAKTEGRDEAAAAWGAPTTGPGVVPVSSSADKAELEAARKSRNLSKIVGVLIKQVK